MIAITLIFYTFYTIIRTEKEDQIYKEIAIMKYENIE